MDDQDPERTNYRKFVSFVFSFCFVLGNVINVPFSLTWTRVELASYESSQDRLVTRLESENLPTRLNSARLDS